MANRDRPQLAILLAMLLLGVALVAGVLLGGGGRSGGRRGDTGASRVSFMENASEFDSAFLLVRPLEVARIAPAGRFDHPMGSENGAMIYDAQPFLEEGHLGADFNGIGGWDSDLGDPVFAVAEGRVLFAGWGGPGWGNFVIVGHRTGDGLLLETVYGHLERIEVAVEDRAYRGRRIGTVGKGAGQYLAHLHFEVRSNPSLHPGPGYAASALDRLAPRAFLEERRCAEAAFLPGSAGAAAFQSVRERRGSVEVQLDGKGRPDGGAGRWIPGEKTVRELRQ